MEAGGSDGGESRSVRTSALSASLTAWLIVGGVRIVPLSGLHDPALVSPWPP